MQQCHPPVKAVALRPRHPASFAAFGVPADASHSKSGGWTFHTVVSGLNEPRGLAFDGRGGLYVAQAGVPHGDAFVVHNGGVTKFRWKHGNLDRAWSRSFAS